MLHSTAATLNHATAAHKTTTAAGKHARRIAPQHLGPAGADLRRMLLRPDPLARCVDRWELTLAAARLADNRSRILRAREQPPGPNQEEGEEGEEGDALRKAEAEAAAAAAEPADCTAN
jgi:hypothetical protein